jgi:hypothetical protein
MVEAIPRMFREPVRLVASAGPQTRSSAGSSPSLSSRPQGSGPCPRGEDGAPQRTNDLRPLGHGLLGLSQDVGGGEDPASASATDHPCTVNAACPIPGPERPRRRRCCPTIFEAMGSSAR